MIPKNLNRLEIKDLRPLAKMKPPSQEPLAGGRDNPRQSPQKAGGVSIVALNKGFSTRS
jgi:hypothetical protein